jgi:hypothetical protein
MSVRSTAAGAVVLATICLFATPSGACDERLLRACEAASAKAFADANAPVAEVRRKPARRTRVVVVRSAKPKQATVRRARAPGFATKRERPKMELASLSIKPVALRDSPLLRRFRGFIDPAPIADNFFDGFRRPRADHTHMVAGASPHATVMTVAASDDVNMEPAETTETVAPATAAATPAIVLPPVPALKLDRVVATAPVAQAAPPVAQAAQPVLVAAPAEPPPGGFSLNQLFLALCGALTAAGALRMIVGV